MRTYRANKMTAEEKEKHRINTKKYRASKATAEDKAVNNRPEHNQGDKV